VSESPEIETRAQEGERVRQQELERLRYEAELSRRRFVRVDPDHRLVADALEAEWNEKLRAFTLATEREQERATAERTVVDEECRKKILALATDLPRVFNDPATPDRERKRMVRLLIEDVTLTRRDEIAIDVRFKGGTTQSLRIPLPLSAWKKRMTSPAVVETIDRMMETQTSTAIAQRLNLDGLQSGEGKPFTPSIVRRIEHDYHLKTRLDRLRARGMLTPEEFARTVDVSPATIRHWRQRSLVHIHVYNGRGEYLIEPPGEDTPTKYMWQHQQKKIAAKTTCSRSDG
jgi:DNA-binding transcriptional regulator YiaG